MGPVVYLFVNSTESSLVAARVELAGTSRERRAGLLHANRMQDSTGLLIVPCEAIHTFAMQIALGALFLNKSLRVTGLRSNLQPWRVAICLLAHSVLELPQGTIERSQTRAGHQLRYRAENAC